MLSPFQAVSKMEVEVTAFSVLDLIRKAAGVEEVLYQIWWNPSILVLTVFPVGGVAH